MQIEKPIFIFGIGRSGTTICHRMLSEHPNVFWLSSLCGRYPDKPYRNRFLMQAIDYPVIGNLLKKKMKPWENYNFWEFYCKGFRKPCRDLVGEDVTNKSKQDIRDVFSQMATGKRNRLLIKITGWPRIGYLNEIFSDAKFIHVLRDGRAVINSRINHELWTGWSGPLNWKYGELTSNQREEWEKSDKSFIALAAIEWKILIDSIEKSKQFLDKENLLEIRYEDFCANPSAELKKIVGFSELNWLQIFENNIKKYNVKNENSKWEKDLTESQKGVLQKILQDYLIKYGYC